MNCADIEILLADYFDGLLDRPDRAADRAAVSDHLAACAGCAALARDAQDAIAFMERASSIEPPEELVSGILFELTHGSARYAIKPSWLERLLGQRVYGALVRPVLQPRFAMGLAMAVLSFSMVLGRTSLPLRNIQNADLNPANVITLAENRVVRTWDRGVKFYESLPMVYEIQSRLEEWAQNVAPDSDSPEPESQTRESQKDVR